MPKDDELSRIGRDGPAEHVLRLTQPEYDAMLAGLRLLARALQTRQVTPDDDDVGSILTNSGEHAGLTSDDVYSLGDRWQEMTA